VQAAISAPSAAAFLIPNGLIPDPQERPRFLACLQEEDAVWRQRVERLGVKLDE
jgi:hypothetical protein